MPSIFTLFLLSLFIGNVALIVKPFRLYLLAIFLLSVVMGLQIIAVPWLALDYLGLSPVAVGFVQAAVLVPNMLLLILGGVSADRGVFRRRWFCILAIYGVLHGLLLLLLSQQWLSLASLLVYSVLLGGITAFMQPFKDYLIGLFAQEHLQTAIAKQRLCQYLGQLVGVALATPLYLWRVESLPVVQCVLVLLIFSVFFVFWQCYSQLLNQHDLKPVNEPLSWALFCSGFNCCWRSPILRGLIAIVAVSGFFHIGVFVVALPLLAKGVYVGEVGFYSVLQGLFIAGTIATTLLVVVRGQLDAPGRRVIFSLLYTGLILLGLSAGPTQYGLMCLIFLWGVTVGISANLGRAILQSEAMAEYRGRAISIYQLALFGCAPLGAFFAGIGTQYWGVLVVLKISAIASFVAFMAMFFTRSLWDLESVQPKVK